MNSYLFTLEESKITLTRIAVILGPCFCFRNLIAREDAVKHKPSDVYLPKGANKVSLVGLSLPPRIFLWNTYADRDFCLRTLQNLHKMFFFKILSKWILALSQGQLHYLPKVRLSLGCQNTNFLQLLCSFMAIRKIIRKIPKKTFALECKFCEVSRA